MPIPFVEFHPTISGMDQIENEKAEDARESALARMRDEVTPTRRQPLLVHKVSFQQFLLHFRRIKSGGSWKHNTFHYGLHALIFCAQTLRCVEEYESVGWGCFSVRRNSKCYLAPQSVIPFARLFGWQDLIKRLFKWLVDSQTIG